MSDNDQHLAYSLENGEVVSRIASVEEVAAASSAAHARLQQDHVSYAMRTCWVCNPAHAHFLQNDNFLFQCMMGCGHWYYQGIDLTGGPHEDMSE